MAENFIASLDFDGVLAHGLNVKRKYAKEWFGVDLELDQTKEKGFDALMKKLGKPCNYRALMDPVNEQHIMEYEIPPDCIPVLTKLYGEGCRFVVITSRNDHDYPYAAQFIKTKFNGLIKYVHNTRSDQKGEFIGRLKPRIHVDDDLSKLVLLEGYPLKRVYYRQPENKGQETNDKRIVQVSTFEEIADVVRRLAA